MTTCKKHNFTGLEKKIFLDILIKYEKVLENKRSDGVSIKAKAMAWERIAREYNGSPYTTQALPNQLRRLWMNLKQRHRDALKKRLQRQRSRDVSSACDTINEPDVSSLTAELLAEVVSTPDSDPLFETTDAQPSAVYIPVPPASDSTPTPEKPLDNKKETISKKILKDKEERANEIHELELQLLKEKIREAKAKADLAELLFEQQYSADNMAEERKRLQNEATNSD